MQMIFQSPLRRKQPRKCKATEAEAVAVEAESEYYTVVLAFLESQG